MSSISNYSYTFCTQNKVNKSGFDQKVRWRRLVILVKAKVREKIPKNHQTSGIALVAFVPVLCDVNIEDYSSGIGSVRKYISMDKKWITKGLKWILCLSAFCVVLRVAGQVENYNKVVDWWKSDHLKYFNSKIDSNREILETMSDGLLCSSDYYHSRCNFKWISRLLSVSLLTHSRTSTWQISPIFITVLFCNQTNKTRLRVPQ